MGGEKFDSPQPESFLFGDNSDLNFLGSKPVPFPYPPPQANEPTKTLKSLVNIRRDSLHFKKVEDTSGGGGGGCDGCSPPKKYNVEFTFDCDVRVAVTIYYLCSEEVTPTGLVLTARDPSLVSPTFQYRRGASQLFSQPQYVFSPEAHEAELSYQPGSEVIPVGIHCVAEEGEEPRQSHLTIAVIERQSDGHFALKAIKQKLYVDGLCYLLQEIYGIENKVGEPQYCGDEDEVEDTGAECVVCMSDMRDTLILPCRHLCLCNACADSLRYQANNCPICRAPFRALLQIRALAKSGHSATHPALAAEAQTEGVPPGYELVNLVEALNGPVTVQHQAVTLTSETQQESEAGRAKKKNRRRGSKDKERRVSATAVAPPAPPPVEEPLSLVSPSPQLTLSSSQRKESITIDIDSGETSSDPLHLVQQELEKQDQDQEPEATTEDELLEKVNLTETNETRIIRRDEDEEDEEEEEGEEDESCSVSLGGSRKQIQSLPPTPSLPRSSNSTRSSSHQSEESVSSSKHLLSSSNSPKVE